MNYPDGVAEKWGNPRKTFCGEYRLFAGAANGKRLAEVPLKRNRSELVFKADDSVYGGVMLYELVRK